MRPFRCVLLCCLLLNGCRAAPEPPTAVAVEPRPDTPAPPPEPEPRSRLDRASECAALHFFTFTEQAAKVAVFPFQAAMLGLYFLFFPVIGFGHGGPG